MNKNERLSAKEYKAYCEIRERHERDDAFCRRHPILWWTKEIAGGVAFCAMLVVFVILMAAM